MAYRVGTTRSSGQRRSPDRKVRHQDGNINGHRPLHVIADEIFTEWRPDPVTHKGGVNYAALPYLRAMQSLRDVYSVYGPAEESAVNIVLRFLGNAQSWRGETARRVKAELKSIIGTTNRRGK